MADYQARIGEFEEKNIHVMAASTESLEEAQKMIERRKLTYPVAYGLDAREFSSRTGAFFDERKGFLHATGFILDPEGKVREGVYSTGPIGRFTAGDALALIGYMAKNSG